MNEASSTPAVLVVVADGVAVLTLNQPDNRNALSPGMISALSACLGELKQRDDVRSVVLTALGKVFSAGLDLAHLKALSQDERVSYMRTAFTLF